MDRFALLSLPTVALIEVLKFFNPIELYHLSQCSRKVAQFIPLAGTKKILLEIDFGILELTMNEEYSFVFPHKSTEKYIHRNCKQNQDPRILQFDFLHDSDTDIVDRLKKSGFNLSALFKCPIKSLEFARTIPNGQCRSIIEEVITAQDTPLENLILSEDLQNEDLKWILEKANVTGKLEIWRNELQNVSVDLNLNCRQFTLDHALWITLHNLVSLKSCVTIELFETNLTYQDLDIYMQKWKSGLFPNLEYLLVGSDSLENDGTIFGFSKEQLSTERGSKREIMIDNDYCGTCDCGVDVKNNDGMKGSIQVFSDTFELFVWKD